MLTLKNHKDWFITNEWLNGILKNLERQEQTKSKPGKWEEIKIIREVNEIKPKKIIQRIDEPKNWMLKREIKDRLLLRPVNQKKESENPYQHSETEGKAVCQISKRSRNF